MWVDLALGVALAVPALLLLRLFGPRWERRLFALALVAAAGVYIAFASHGGGLPWLLIETGGALLYLAFAILGLQRSPWFVAAGWALHVLWDVGLHLEGATPFVPGWYPLACVSFDLIFAVYAASRCPAWEQASVRRQGSR